ncbi:MAG: SIMPL domain-containing protein [Maribacter sp.]
MKKAVAILTILLITMNTNAQKLENTMTVSGYHTYDIAPEYSSKMIVSMNNVYYDAQTMSLSEIKSGYLDKLAKIGISSDRLEEDNLHYALLGYEKEGTVLIFKSKSLKETQKFLSVKSIGISRSDTTQEGELTEAQMADYAKAAFDDAKSKATAIAAKIGRTVGKAIQISDTNSKKMAESLYYANYEAKRDYYISVSFELQ